MKISLEGQIEELERTFESAHQVCNAPSKCLLIDVERTFKAAWQQPCSLVEAWRDPRQPTGMSAAAHAAVAART